MHLIINFGHNDKIIKHTYFQDLKIPYLIWTFLERFLLIVVAN